MARGRKTGGRQKGTPNKYTISMKDAVLETFAKLGDVKHMVAWAKENPSDFYRIAAKLIPQQIQADVNHTQHVSELSNAELDRRIAALSGETSKEALADEPDSVH